MASASSFDSIAIESGVTCDHLFVLLWCSFATGAFQVSKLSLTTISLISSLLFFQFLSNFLLLLKHCGFDLLANAIRKFLIAFLQNVKICLLKVIHDLFYAVYNAHGWILRFHLIDETFEAV